MRLILTFSLVVLAGCGKAASTEATSSLNLFKIWTNSNGDMMDLTSKQVGTNTVDFVFANNLHCSCTLALTGTTESGTYTMSACGTNINCPQIEGTGNYTNNGALIFLGTGYVSATYH